MHLLHYEDIPLNKYKVLYFDTRWPNKIVATDYSDHIGISTADNVHGISPNNFGARWVGMFEFPESTEKEISIDQSWASTALKIDGNYVGEGAYVFTPGTHKIECSYSNNWHTIDVLVSITDPIKEVTTDELGSQLKLFSRKKNAKSYYIGVYESNKDDHSIEVSLKKVNNDEELIIFLSSYGAVNWKIKNPYNLDIKTVAYNSYKSGSTVEILGDSNADIYKYPELERAYGIYPYYDKVGHDYDVEDDEFPKLNEQITELTGSRLDGWTDVYASEEIRVPSLLLDDEEYKKINQAYDEMYAIVNAPPQRPDNLFGDRSLTESWGDVLDLKGYIPTGVFKAYHFNTQSPESVVTTGIIDEPKMNYAWSDFRGIDSNDYGGYFVGQFDFDETVTKELNFFNGWSFIRVLVDGEVIFKGWEADALSIEYVFTKGKHIIELEYINDWHTTDFMMTISNGIVPKPVDKVKNFIEENSDEDTQFFVLNDYGSSNEDFTSHLDFTDIKGKVFLIINSNNPIHWVIEDTLDADLQGVVYSSYWMGSKVVNKTGKEIPTILVEHRNVDLDYPRGDEEVLSYESSQYKRLEMSIMNPYGIDTIKGMRLHGGNPRIYRYLFDAIEAE